MTRFKTSDLTYNKETNTFSEEASTLSCIDENLRYGFPECFELESTRTGLVKLFKFYKYHRNMDNELQAVEYICGEFKAIIFND